MLVYQMIVRGIIPKWPNSSAIFGLSIVIGIQPDFVGKKDLDVWFRLSLESTDSARDRCSATNRLLGHLDWPRTIRQESEQLH